MGCIVPPLSTNVALTLKTDYCGNMIYENGQLSKILTDVGYITLANSTPTYHYYLQDHLGNNRVVIDEHGQVEQVNHYYAFGGLMGESTGGGTQPYKYNGKELDRMHGLDWYDYSARYYDAVLGRWMCVDPLAEKYFNVSGYIYCIDNPIKLNDVDGKAPIYSNRGVFLGTDDKGLSGDYIIMDKRFFKQGMPHSQAQKHLYLGNIAPGAYRKIWNHNAELVKRPDYDGYVTISEGIKWAKEHPNALKHPTPDNTLYIDASKLDFGSLSTSDFKEEKKVTPQNLLSKDISRFIKSIFCYSERNVVYALGRVNMILLNRNRREVKVVNDNATDYDWNKGGGLWRSFLINFERGRTGLNDSHGFKTLYYAVGHLKE